MSVESTANPADGRSTDEEAGGARSRAAREGRWGWKREMRNRETEKRRTGIEAAIWRSGGGKRAQNGDETESLSESSVVLKDANELQVRSNR